MTRPPRGNDWSRSVRFVFPTCRTASRWPTRTATSSACTRTERHVRQYHRRSGRSGSKRGRGRCGPHRRSRLLTVSSSEVESGVRRVDAAEFAAKVRRRETVVGYWVVLDSPTSTERLAGVGYDYVCLDGQHGLFGYSGMLAGLTAIDAAGQAVGMVRVAANDATPIGRALDAGAAGVIVPLVNTAEDAAKAVSASRYPPVGIRSYGPMRSMLRIGPTPAEANESVIVLAMIETPQGLADVDAIAATPGLDGLYIGPSDLTLAVGGAGPADPSVADTFEAALVRV